MDKTVGSAFGAHYAQLRVLARYHLSRERAKISTGTLAHDVFLRMRDGTHLRFATREHFLSYVSLAMRNMLIEMARQRGAIKRGGGQAAETMSQVAEVPEQTFGNPERLLALNQAFERLGKTRPRLLRVAEMHALFDMDFAEISVVLKLSESQVKRDWKCARAFIFDLVESGG